MGLEAHCRVRSDGHTGEGKALLETTELIFRGDFRIVIPFKEITAAEDAGGELVVTYGGGHAVFELGANAAKWADRIRNPRSLIDKLEVKPGAAVAVLGVDDASFMVELRDRTDAVSDRVAADADVIFYEADNLDDLMRLLELRQSIKPKGAIWVVSPKGKGAPIKDTDVMAAARDAGLVDTKVASFSDTHTALKLVIPAAKR
jgi:hypothetical protein